MKKNKIPVQKILIFLVFLIILPFGINIVYFISKGAEHQLMIYSLFLLYIFTIKLMDICSNNKNKYSTYLTNFVSFLFIIILISSIIYSNQCYLKKNLEFDSTITTMNRIIYKLEETTDYKVGESKVAFIGNLQASNVSLNRKEFDYNSVGLSNNFSITYYKTFNQYFANYLGYPINIVSENEMKSLCLNDEVKKMESFPNSNYIKRIDDVFVIKLSEVSN